MMIAAIQLSAAAREFACLATFASKGRNHLKISVITGLNVCQDAVQTRCAQLLMAVFPLVEPTVIATKTLAVLSASVRVLFIVKMA